jgi:probable HAF family extracellular repeat protein
MKTIALCLTSVLATPALGSVAITNLGSLGGVAYGYGVSGDGSTAVGNSSNSTAFRWRQSTGMVALGSGRAVATNHNGTVTVGFSGRGTSDDSQAVSWNSDGTTTVLAGRGWATGVSGDGSVITGTTWTGAGQRAFKWTPASGTVYLGDGGYGMDSANGVSEDGSVVVGGDGGSAVRWLSDGSRQILGNLVYGAQSTASACNADGTVVVGGGNTYDAYQNRAFRWTAASGMTDLGALGVGWTYASGVSADGTVVVGESAGRAFVWSARTGMLDLGWALGELGVDLEGMNLRWAMSISADGRTIVGGAGTAWMISGFDINAITVPTPAASTLLLASGLLARRRRG